MRGLVALCLTLAVAALSGCVELVEGEEPDVDAAAEEADRLLDEYNDKAGHIAGTVTGADGQVLEGATVDLMGGPSARSDEAGRFTFLDLTPGVYSLAANAADHVETRMDVEVAAGQFARPDVALAPVPAPEPYFTTYRFDGYDQFSTGLFGFEPFGCSCGLEGELDPEGLAELVIEAEVTEHSSFLPPAHGFTWTLDAWGEDEGSSLEGYEPTPMHVHVAADQLVPQAGQFYLGLRPEASLFVSMGQSYTGYLTAFYHEPAPEGFTALGLE